jgi:hypothetical protein
VITAIAFVNSFTSRDSFLRFLVGLLSSLTEYLYKLQGDPVWRSANGRVRRVSRMDDNHLENTINLLVREGSIGDWSFPYLLAERRRRMDERRWSYPGSRKRRHR